MLGGMTVDVLPLPSYDDAQVVVPGAGCRPRQLGGRGERGARRRHLLADLPGAPPAHRGPRRLGRRRQVVRRRDLRAGRRRTPGGVRLRVLRAAGAGAGARASAGGSTSPVRPRTPSTGGSTRLTAATPEELPRGDRRVVLPGDDRVAVKDPVVERTPDGWRMWLCCHPLTEAGPRGPDDHAPADQPRRARLDRPGRGARRSARPLGRPRRPGDDRGRQHATARGAVRRPRRRRLQLVRDDRCRPLGRPAAWSPDDDRARSRPRTPTAPGATPRPCRCPTAAPASTSRPRAPTARTTWSRSSAERYRSAATPACGARRRSPSARVESQSE